MEKCRKKSKMIKMGQILIKKVKIDEKCKKQYFFDFSEKYWKMSKKLKNDENGSDIDEKGEHWWEIRKILFLDFLQKNIEKCQKKVKNDKNGSDID